MASSFSRKSSILLSQCYSAWNERLTSFFVFLLLLTQNLTTLCHLDQLLLVTHINLSSNQLLRLPPQFAMLQCLEVNWCFPFLSYNCHSVFLLNDHTVVRTQVLEADDNAIESLEGLYHLPKLEEVSLRNNRILFSKKSRCFIRNPFSGVGAGAWFDSVFFINKQIQTCSWAKFCHTHLFQTEMV